MMNKNRVIAVKVVIWLLALIPLMRLFWLGLSDNLGANPIEFVEHSTGIWALVCLLASLSMTPIRLLTRQVWQIQIRRLLGLWMFFYAFLHVAAYVWLDFNFLFDEMIQDVVEHPRILVGFVAFLLTVPLVVTSNNHMKKKLKSHWKTLHKTVYLVAILAVLHFLLLVKKDLTEPFYYAAILLLLFSIRIYFKYKTKNGSTT
jgi:sulfoxide reductase heme-binding subunit YedZ